MFYNINMEQFDKLKILSENLDVDDENHASIQKTCEIVKNSGQYPDVTYAKLPGGGTIPLLKTMVSSICEKNCNYCAFRSGRDIRRATFSPDELADTFLSMVNKKIVKGLFLSSGILGKGIFSQDRIIATAEILRVKKKFQGYLHLKVMPGAEKDQIKELMKYADRVSINLEAPNPERLSTLAPKKDFFNEIFTRLKWIYEIKSEDETKGVWKNRWPSISTQFVVGPANENDRELIQSTAYLFDNLKLARVYFMAFSPVLNTPFENISPENPVREHRLYQASFLLRDYGFQATEFFFDSYGKLSLDTDPKTIWANEKLLHSPFEINTASFQELLRIPGIGPKRAASIISYRKRNRIKTLGDLSRLGISCAKSGNYILINGKKSAMQLKLF
jgi:predicted DNA-binding helix-hairpin-helix protein